jgi:hypothetical protein
MHKAQQLSKVWEQVTHIQSYKDTAIASWAQEQSNISLANIV